MKKECGLSLSFFVNTTSYLNSPPIHLFTCVRLESPADFYFNCSAVFAPLLQTVSSPFLLLFSIDRNQTSYLFQWQKESPYNNYRSNETSPYNSNSAYSSSPSRDVRSTKPCPNSILKQIRSSSRSISGSRWKEVEVNSTTTWRLVRLDCNVSEQQRNYCLKRVKFLFLLSGNPGISFLR